MKNNVLKTTLLIALLIGSVGLFAQEKDPVLLTVDGQNISLSEFEAVYKKNNRDDVVDQEDLKEYLELYINFRLKVREAESLGMDTVKKFIQELKGYQKQLAKPYLTDKEVTEKLIEEAYERSLKDIRASHILLKIGPDALPKDTLKVYNEIMSIRKQAMKGGNFASLAKKHSQDPSAKDNGGDLGWFSVLRMVYPFETAAYNTPVGEISEPVRTRFGYHIIKVVDKRDAQGEMRAAHIMIKTGPEATEEQIKEAKTKIDEVKGLLDSGKNFEDLAKKYSEDRGSADKGGALPTFGTGRMVPEFEAAAFGLKEDGDYSEPVLTEYGWHIVKRLERIPVASFEDSEANLSAKVSKDSRSQMSQTVVLNRVKKENGFTENRGNLDAIGALLDSTLIEGKWDAAKAKDLGGMLFSIGDKKYTQGDFANYIGTHQTRRREEDLLVVMNGMYNQYVQESLLAFEESKLPEKHPEYKALLKEYRDGILLFDLTDEKVWSKAVKDTAGLKAFHDQNRDKFMWGKRLDAELYYCQNDSIKPSLEKTLKKRSKKWKQDSPSKDEILKEFNVNSALNLRIESDKYQEDEEEILKQVNWEKGLQGPFKDGDNDVYVLVKEVIEPTPKTLKEARGLVTAEYQNYLEKEWIKELREKYKYTANADLLKQIK
ncbi:MAG: peptidylprolyl isomerase [Flavobacteriales bacterium]|nr:peptidylprolyl isomerase [Flavobacteriales bacterium]MCB9192497.1 peptidylprolyl isomerase [Flavobacteriales bacterium]